MSYDLHLFFPEPGVDLEATWEARVDAEETARAGGHAGPPDPAAEERKRALARALRALDPALEEFDKDFAAIAAREGIDEEQARRRFRHVELNTPDDDLAVQIVLHDDGAEITFPHGHEGAWVRTLFGRVWSYLELLEREAGFRTYDPQLGRPLDLGRDRAAAEKAYAAASGRTREVLAGKRRRPWWKFW